MKNARKNWKKCDQNLSNIRLFGRGVKLTGNLKHMLTAPHIGSLNLIRWKRKLLKSINGSQQISNSGPLKILIFFGNKQSWYVRTILKENKRRRHISSCCQGGLRTSFDNNKKLNLFSVGREREGGGGGIRVT